jgi:thymidine phosphorylase
MVSLGNECGVSTRAILTGMDTPVGRAAGNWLEVKEAVDCLEGGGPSDLHELVLDCAAHLLLQTRRAKNLASARKQAEDCLASQAPRAKWDEMIVAQGADLNAFNRKLMQGDTASWVVEVKSPKKGFVSHSNARVIGEVVRDLGGGRLTKESKINYDVGVDGLLKPGEAVDKGTVLARVHAADAKQAEAAVARLKTAFGVSARKPKTAALVLEVIAAKK